MNHLRWLSLLISILAATKPALASWGFTANLYSTDCPSSTPAISLPTITGFPNDSYCETTRTAVLAITQSFSWTSGNPPVNHLCKVGYTVSSCSGTDDSFGSGGAFSPLQDGVASVNPLGPSAGAPSFTPHYTQATQDWQQQASAWTQSYAALNTGVSAPLSQIRFQNYYAWNLENYCHSGKCAGSSPLAGSVIRTQNPQYSQPDQPQRMSDDPSVTGDLPPPITIDPAQAFSIGGAGVTQGQPDKPPPPTPEHVNRNEHCKQGWWYNTATHNCYGAGYDDCNADNSAGKHRCILGH